MTTRRLFLAGIAAVPFLLNAPARAMRAADEILVGLPNNIFANLHDGRPTGLLAEAIDLILRDMGRKPVYIVMSNADMSAALRDGTVGLNSVTVLTSADAEAGLYTDAIVTEFNIVAVRAGQKLRVEHLGDLHGLKLGGRAGYLYPRLDADPQIRLQRFSQDGELIRNLIHGRIDAAIISALSDVYKFRAEGVMTRIRLLNRSVGQVPLRAVMSRHAFSEVDLADFNKRLAALKAGPQWAEILERNGFSDLAVDWPMVDN